jgi:hypothetical protein
LWVRAGAVAVVALFTMTGSAAIKPCEIDVVEQGTGWPVPLVELRTKNGVSFVTDNAGVVAFDLPELMGQEVWFGVHGQGYEVPKDGFGLAGAHFKMDPGARYRIEVTRTIIAKRLGRLTGAGLFGESQKLGRESKWQESGVLGCDTIQNAVYDGRMFWFWGDTQIPRYGLEIFDGTGATTAVKPVSNFEPPLRVAYDYFTDEKARPRGIAKMPGRGPTWVAGCVTLPDAAGKEHLVTSYGKVEGWLDIYQWGLAVWNDSSKSFEPLRVIWEKSAANPKRPLVLDGHAVKWTDAAGKNWVLFCNPFPMVRCPATFEAWQDTNSWQRLEMQKTLRAADSEEKVNVHGGSIAWNPWRKRWVTIFVQAKGTSSNLGEIWYAEADAPTGPWGSAVKVLSHDNYSFYNPVLHPEFTSGNSPVLIFEGTYTAEFANRPQITPKYNYNQILYRLDLDDSRLLPAHGK